MLQISEEELQELLERAAEAGADRAFERMTVRIYQEVGKSVLKKLAQTLGCLVVAGILYAINQGWIKP